MTRVKGRGGQNTPVENLSETENILFRQNNYGEDEVYGVNIKGY